MEKMNMEGSHIATNNVHKIVSWLTWEKRDKVFSLRGQQLEELRLNQSEMNVLIRGGERNALDLSENKLRELNLGFFLYFPQQLGSITKLDLSRNNIDYIPTDLNKLKLTHLNLYGNNIRCLVPSMGKMKSLVWLNLNRNPINSISASFRKIAGPMSTDEDCKEAAIAVVSWMQETGNILNLRSQHHLDLASKYDEDKGRTVSRKMRNLANSSTSVMGQESEKYRHKRVESGTRFKVIHPPGVPPILIKADTEPFILKQVPRRRTLHPKSFIFLSFILLVVSALFIPTDTFEQTIKTYLFFLPCVLSKLVMTSHSMTQSFIMYWFPKLDTQIFLRAATECIVHLIHLITGTVFDCLQSGIM